MSFWNENIKFTGGFHRKTCMIKSGWVAWWRSIYLKMNGIKRSSLEFGLIVITWFWMLCSLYSLYSSNHICHLWMWYISFTSFNRERVYDWFMDPTTEFLTASITSHIKMVKSSFIRVSFKGLSNIKWILFNLLSNALRRKKEKAKVNYEIDSWLVEDSSCCCEIE